MSAPWLFLAFVLLSGSVSPALAEDAAASTWPATIVKIEDLRPLTSFKLRVRELVAQGKVTGPSVLRGHITLEGTVAQVSLLESCGNPDLDEASIHALRAMRFKPHMAGGVPTEATLVLPVHVPARFGRSPR